MDSTLVSTANFTIQRGAGSFDTAIVYGQVTESTNDIYPNSGFVEFSDGDTNRSFAITAQEDQVCSVIKMHAVTS